MHTPLSRPPRLPLIAASILSADFAHMGRDCRAALDAGADLLHLDVMDGQFVPNLTMGPAMCAALRRAFPETCLDVHLMVQRPAMFIDPFADAGASHLTVHVEAEGEANELAEAIRARGMTAGLAINPPTSLAAMDSPEQAIAVFDLILVMSVNPGFAGQSFIPEVLEKCRAIKPMLRPEQRLEIDGGVNRDTASACREAGCDVLVAASAIFGSDDYTAAIEALRGRERQVRVEGGKG